MYCENISIDICILVVVVVQDLDHGRHEEEDVQQIDVVHAAEIEMEEIDLTVVKDVTNNINLLTKLSIHGLI